MSDHYHHVSEIQGAADDRHGHPGLEGDISGAESDLRNHLAREVAEQAEQLRALSEQVTALSSALAAAFRHAGMSLTMPAPRHLRAVPRTGERGQR